MFNKELQNKVEYLERQVFALCKEVKNLSEAIDALKSQGYISEVFHWDGYKYYRCDPYPPNSDVDLLLKHLGLEIKHVQSHNEIVKVNDENSSNGK